MSCNAGGADIATVIVLHGQAALPRWLTGVVDRPVVVIRNDAGAQSLQVTGPNVVVHDNAVPAGFAENVNVAIAIAVAAWRPPAVTVANFDLEMSWEALDRLAQHLLSTGAAACGAVMTDDVGRMIFSSGQAVQPASEFLRSAGLRGPRLLAMQRVLLRRIPAWRGRNSTAYGPGSYRMVPPGQYLPWTCIAIDTRQFATIGPLDERFFMYGEDVDWSLRAHELGAQLLLADVGSVVHAERATANRFVDSQYEVSQLILHSKWGFDRAAYWQRWGLRIRRVTPLRFARPGLDWSIINPARVRCSAGKIGGR